MTDFLYRLVDRSHGVPSVAAPMIGGLFGPGPDVPPTIHSFVEHESSERMTKGVGDPSGAGSNNAAIDSPLVAARDASFQVTDHNAPPRETNRTSFANQYPTDDLERPYAKRTNPFGPMGSAAQLDLGPDAGDDFRADADRSIDEDEPAHLPAGVRSNHIEPAAVSTVISIRETMRRRDGLDPNSASLADQDPTDAFLSLRKDKTAPLGATHATAQHDDRDVQIDVQIDERPTADGHEVSLARTAETRGQPVHPGRSSTAPTVISTSDRKHPEEAFDSKAPLIEVDYSTGGFEKSRQMGSSLAPGGGMDHFDERDPVRVALQRKPGTTSAAMETTGRARHARAVRKSGESVVLHSTATVPPGDDFPDAKRLTAMTVKSPTGRGESLDSDGAAKRAQENPHPPTAFVVSKDWSHPAPGGTVGAGEAPRTIAVSPRILTNRPSDRYATDEPSVRPAAGPIAFRREDADSTTPTIRVTIGRIDVRAVSPPPQPPAQEDAPAAPRMSLDDYLRQQNGRP